MALSSLLANDAGRHGYSNGYRTFDYASDPSTIRYKQYADEAKRLGLTDPNQIHQYAIGQNLEWGGQHGIKDTDIKRGKIGVGAIGLAGAGAYGLGAAGATGAGTAAASEGAALPTAAYVPGAEDAIAGELGGAGASTAGGLPGSDMTVTSRLGGTGAGSAMSRILDGTATTADWLNITGNLASTGLGIAGSRNAANAYGGLADQYMQFGAPSRARYEASMSPGFDPTTIPGYSGALDTASRGILARLSATGGNPYGNPGGLVEANRQIISGTALPAIQEYQRLNAGTGGYAGFNAAAPATSAAQIGAQGGVYNAVGSGLAGLLNPQPSLLDTLRGLGVSGLS